jgi:hypothetical protein
MPVLNRTIVSRQEARLIKARENHARAWHELQTVIRQQCPGKHWLVQYRDGKPARCPECHRDRYGNEPRA